MTAKLVLALSTVIPAVVSLLPGSLQHALFTLFHSTESLLMERWEWRVIAVLLMAPTATFALFLLALAVALLWPFTFLAATVGGLAALSWYVFWPPSQELRRSATQPSHPPHLLTSSTVPCQSCLSRHHRH